MHRPTAKFHVVICKTQCLICNDTIAVLKEYKIRRHYEAKHLLTIHWAAAHREIFRRSFGPWCFRKSAMWPPAGKLWRPLLYEVGRATTISRLLYAFPAWWGFTTANDRQKLQRFLQRAKRLGYLPPEHQDLDRMMEDADVRLLLAVNRNSQHVLRGLFPPTVCRPYALRPRPHEYELPKKDDHNFISRVLYRTIRDVKI